MKRIIPTIAAYLAAASIAWAATTVPLSNLTDTYNNVATTYCSWCMTISGASYAPGSRVIRFIGGDGTVLFGMDPTGIFHASGGANNAYILNAGASDVQILNSTVNLFGIGTPTITFGANNNPGLNKVSLTGSAIGSNSGCGASPSVSTNASDFMGAITTGAGATTCAMSFSATKGSAPNCIVQNQTDATVPAGITPSTTAISWTAAASKKYVWMCNDKG